MKNITVPILWALLFEQSLLDNLESWAKTYFSDIKNRNLDRTVHDPEVFTKETTRIVQIDPVKYKRSSTVFSNFRNKRYVSE